MPASLASIPFKRPLPTASTSTASGTSVELPTSSKVRNARKKQSRIVESASGEPSSEEESLLAAQVHGSQSNSDTDRPVRAMEDPSHDKGNARTKKRKATKPPLDTSLPNSSGQSHMAVTSGKDRMDGAPSPSKKKAKKGADPAPASDLDELASDREGHNGKGESREETVARQKREKKERRERKARKRAKREEKQRKAAAVAKAEAGTAAEAVADETEEHSPRTATAVTGAAVANAATDVAPVQNSNQAAASDAEIDRSLPFNPSMASRRDTGKFAVSDDDDDDDADDDPRERAKGFTPLEILAPDSRTGSRRPVPVIPSDPTNHVAASRPPSPAPAQLNSLSASPQNPFALPSSSPPLHAPRDIKPFRNSSHTGRVSSPVEHTGIQPMSELNDSLPSPAHSAASPRVPSSHPQEDSNPLTEGSRLQVHSPSPAAMTSIPRVRLSSNPLGPGRRSASPLAIATLTQSRAAHAPASGASARSQSHIQDRQPHQLSRSVSLAPRDDASNVESSQVADERELPTLEEGDSRHPADGLVVCEGKDQTGEGQIYRVHESVVAEQTFAFERRGDLLRKIDFDMCADRRSSAINGVPGPPDPPPLRARIVFRTSKKEANIHRWPILFQLRLNNQTVRSYNKLVGKAIVAYQALDVTSLLDRSGVNSVTLARWPQDLLPSSLSISVELFSVVARASAL